jgi:hypothetical protein
MGTLGHHKRRRRNTHEHGCNNNSGRAASLPSNENGQDQEVQQPPPTLSSPVKGTPPSKTAASSTITPLSFAQQKAPQASTQQKAPPARKIVASYTTHEKVVAEFTTQELSAFLAFLQTAASSTITPQCGNVTTATAMSGLRTDSPTNDGLPLHCNNKYTDFAKLQEFDLDFGSFSYKVNEFGRKTQRDSREAIRQAESRATNKIVTAIIDAGDDDPQQALALHRSLVDARTRKLAKSAGFQLDRMEAIS